MNNFRHLPLAALLTAGLAAPLHAQAIVAAGKPAQLDIRVAGEHSLRVTLKPLDMKESLPPNPALVDRRYPSPGISVRTLTKPVRRKVGTFDVTVTPQPLTVAIRNADGSLVQEIGFADNGDMTFRARRAAGARARRRRTAAAERPQLARGSRPVRPPRQPRHDGAALAERHVRVAQPGRDDARHARLGPVRRRAVGPGRHARRQARRAAAVAADADPERAAERTQPAAGARQGPAADRRDRARLRRPLRLRRPRPAGARSRTTPRSPARR